MGLLDLDTPGMGMAMGLLNASGPSRMPVSMGQALGQGMQGMREAQQVGYQNQQRQMQMDEYKRKIAQQEAMQKALATAPAEVQQAVAMGVPMEKIWERMNPTPDKPQLVEVADPNDPLRMIKQWVRPGEQTGVQVGYGALPDILDPRVQAAKTRIAQAGASRMTVNQPYEKQFDKERATLDAKQLDGYRSSADAARSMLGTVARLEGLNPEVYAGGGAGAKLASANFLQGMGVNIGDPKKVAASQEFDALATKSVLDSLGGSLGAGVSNADVSFIQKTVPQLGHSAEARASMMKFMREKAARQIKRYESASSYADEKGNLKGWKPERVAIRTGNYGGKKVTEYDDGSIE